MTELGAVHGRLAAIALIVLVTIGGAEARPRADTALNPGLGEPPASVQRATPHESLLGYLEAGREGDWAAAAHYLWLSHLPLEQQRREGPALARRLMVVMERTLRLDLGRVSDDPTGDVEETAVPADEDQIGAVTLGSRTQPIRLARVQVGKDAYWLFSRSTVDAIGRMYAAHGHGWLGERVPEWMAEVRVLELELWQLAGILLALLLAPLLGLAARWVVLALGARTLRRMFALPPGEQLRAGVRGPLGVMLTLLALGGLLRLLSLPLGAHDTLGTLVRTGVLVAGTWFTTRFVVLGARLLDGSLRKNAPDERKRRSIATQVMVLRRIVNFFVLVIGGSLTLLQFDVVRTVGVSILASAGLAGVILGLAAQRSMANVLAGIQVSLTEPFRIGDAVTVESDYGIIEEIELTYVVVKVWDQRRLVVPIANFLERPFYNWTRTTPETLGTVYLYADYSIEPDAVRAELARILAATPLWDGNKSEIQVTKLEERWVEVRALISARTPDDAWDLRCFVRERLLAWLQREGRHLPTVRVTVDKS